MEKSDLLVWRFCVSFGMNGRLGTIDSVFTESKENIDNAIGQVAHFGNNLHRVLQSEDFVVLDTFNNPDIELYGKNPLEYIRELEVAK